MKRGRVQRWSTAVVVANVTFVAAWLLAASWQGPRYSLTAHSISDMYASGTPGAAFLIVVITLCGAAVLMFAWRSLWPGPRPGRSAAVGVTLLSDTSSLGLALAVPAWLQPVADGPAGPAEFLAWTGIDAAHTVNAAVAMADDPANVDGNDYVKTTFTGKTSQLPISVASVPYADSSVAIIAWAATVCAPAVVGAEGQGTSYLDRPWDRETRARVRKRHHGVAKHDPVRPGRCLR
jgi:hypothetical protein